MSDKCPICGSDIKDPTQYGSDKTHGKQYSCSRCGDFQVPWNFPISTAVLGGDAQKIAILSHWIRIQHEAIAKDYSGKLIELNEELVDNIIKNPPPNPAEQADNFVRWLGENVVAPGEEVLVAPSTHQAIMGSQTPNGFALVIGYLFNTGMVIGQRYDDYKEPGKAHVTLSFEGWKRFEKLKCGAIDSRKVFMAMRYGDEQLDKIVEEIFKPAVKKTGFDLFKLPDRPQPAGLIDDRIRVEIQTSRFLIADLTHENRGAYWEAGYAEGLGKPVIYTCEKKKFRRLKTHFDTNHHLTILWDADNLGESAEKLKETIRATLPGEAKLTDD